MFPHIVHHSCMDRASSNLKVEASLVDARTKKQSRLAVACTIHKAHKTQTAVHSVVPEVVSGQIGLAVAMRPGGAVATLQEVLHRFFQARLQVYYTAAPGPGTQAWKFREATLEMYLGCDEGDRGVRRRTALQSLLNGNWLVWDKVEHFCSGPGCCSSREQTIELLADLGIAALVPAACPPFERARWTRSNLACNYVGLLANCHGILQQTLPPWLKTLADAKNMPSVHFFQQEAREDDEDWEAEDLGHQGFMLPIEDAIADEAGHNALVVADADAEPAEPGLELAMPLGASGVDWKKINTKAHGKAKQFATLPVLRRSLVLLRQCMRPSEQLLHGLLSMGSDAWEEKMFDFALSGSAVDARTSTKLMACASGHCHASRKSWGGQRCCGAHGRASPRQCRRRRWSNVWSSLVEGRMYVVLGSRLPRTLQQQWRDQ